MSEIDFKKIEEKWQKKWEEKKIFEVKEDPKRKKFYVLEMFPYPSGSGLHMGHAWNYTIGDILARLKIMQGFNVLHPMGYDALGLPAENAAIKEGVHPSKYTEASIKNYIRQQKELGLSYDWSRVVNTSDPSYYKWDQWIFLKMFEKGLAYQKESAVNFCPKCDTVLANEQVQDGKCWRHEDTEVEIKTIKQWFFKITDYADELYEEIDNLNDWPERTKAMQKNWIGKSYGTEIEFEINRKKWPIFTTRPDTIYGVTFMVVSAQHPKLFELVTSKQKQEVENFLKKLKSVSEKELAEMDKMGVFTGSYAINPVTKEKVPVWAGNFVVADYGSGMVMAVPAHDQRDFEFAKKYGIDIKQVVVEVKDDYTPDCKVQLDKETVNRDSVVCIVKHWEDDKYLCLDWKNINWHTPVTGGVEEGESPEETGAREILEETGFTNAKFIGKGFDVIGSYYHPKKKINRFERQTPVFFELIDGKQKKISKEESEKHNVLWIPKEEVEKFLNHDEKNYDARVALHVWAQYVNPRAITDKGILINSGEFSGMENEKAKEEITKFLEKKKLGKKVVQFRLRDWGISRQRYWGTPIPIIHCAKCGIVPVPEKDLPVELPLNVKFGKGNPLTTDDKWLNVKCSKCGGKAKREAETMDTFVNSSWYFLRYCDAKNEKEIFEKKKVDYWCPIDVYIGGAEHACMHLIYFRFYTKFLRDIGLLKFNEPAKKLFHQGMLHGEGGIKMSKSKGNVVLPETVSEKYGIDTARFFLCSLASPDKDIDWSESGIVGSLRFVNKIFDFVEKNRFGKTSEKVETKLNQTIKNVTNYFDSFDYRKASIELRELFDLISNEPISKEDFGKFLKLLNPICPHVTEELWERIGSKGFISNSEWPKYDEKLISKKKESKIDLNEKYSNYVGDIVEKIESKGEKVKKIFVYVVPFELANVDEKKLSKNLGKEVKVYSVADPKKHDPEGKSKKTIPGMPGVWVE